LHDTKFIENDWILLAIWFSNTLEILYLLDHARFFDVTCIMLYRSDVKEFNINKFKFLNFSIARINAIHFGDSKARKADFNIAKSFKSYLLLSRGSRVILRFNL